MHRAVGRARAVAALVAMASVATACGGGGGGGGGGGSDRVGEVQSVIARRIEVNGEEVNDRRALVAGDVVTTNSLGQVALELDGENTCRAFQGSRLRVRPADAVVVEWAAGSSGCQTRGEQLREFRAGDAVIEARDSVFDVEVTADGKAVVTVSFGLVEVRRPEGQPVVVGADQQTAVPQDQPVQTPAPPPAPLPVARALVQRQLVDTQAKPLFTRPTVASDTLAKVVARNQFVVGVDSSVASRTGAETFARGYFADVSSSWQLGTVRIVPLVPAQANRQLAEGTLDAFVTPAATPPPGTIVLPFFEDPAAVAWRLVVRQDAAFAGAMTQYLLGSVKVGRYRDVYTQSFATTGTTGTTATTRPGVTTTTRAGATSTTAATTTAARPALAPQVAVNPRYDQFRGLTANG